MKPRELSDSIKSLAHQVGFERCGIALVAPLTRGDYVHQWIAAGHAGTMEYLLKNLDQRLNPALLLEGARSIIVVALSYHQAIPQGLVTDPSRPREEAVAADVACELGPLPHGHGSDGKGRIAKYAWGEDYHVVVKDKLFAMMRRLETETPEPLAYRVCVDTSPLIEREAAALAGIGWIGKNTLVLHQDLGSYFFLGAVVTTLDLVPDAPTDDHCGTCTACLNACPTQAFPAPYEMDASRCISYLTIEHRGDIAPELAEKMGDWIFGCDVCQEVCPFNRHAPTTREPRLASRPPAPGIPANDVLSWSADDYRRTLRGTAMKRAKLTLWKRNAQIVAENGAMM